MPCHISPKLVFFPEKKRFLPYIIITKHFVNDIKSNFRETGTKHINQISKTKN